MGRAKGHVRFENLSFAYESRLPALKMVNINAEPGQITAILGAPGSGKTTVVNLLPRFYDVTEGRITIDGRDIREFTLASLRHNVGIVQQDVFLFGGSIRDNIAYGAVDASFEDVVAAAKVAVEFAKKNGKLTIIGGALDDKMLGVDDIKALAALPSLDELRAKIVGLLAAPATQIAVVLGAPAGQIARVVRAYSEKDEAA